MINLYKKLKDMEAALDAIIEEREKEGKEESFQEKVKRAEEDRKRRNQEVKEKYNLTKKKDKKLD